MKEILVNDIIEKCNGKLVCGNKDDICTNFKKDTREIKKGDTFVGIKGENFDGNKFFEEALKNGATTCILQGVQIDKEIIKKYSDINIVMVEDTIKAIGILAKYKRSLFNIPVVGVTGSVGKTSTKDIVASVVSKKYNVHKTLGNFNSDIGLPLTILSLKEENTAMVLEMGMNHKGEISYLANIAKPDIAIITNVGSSHIGNLGSRENILKAKLEILEGLNENGIFIYNNDNDMLNTHKEWYKEYKNKNFGIDNNSDLMAYNIVTNENGSSFNVKIDNKEYDVYVPVSGKHFVYNSLCAISVGLQLGIDINDIIDGIKEFSLTKNRMEIKNVKNGITLINDSYNASYDSMKAGLEFLGTFKDKLKIAVLGDMLELGEFSDELHTNVGKCVSENNVDILVTVGNYSKKIVESAVNNGMKKENVYNVNNNGEAIELINKNIKENSVVLIKASNSMNFVEIFNKLLEEYN